MTLAVGSLFSGVGGLDLGLERAGMRVAWHAEITRWPSRVLRRRWPGVPNLGDVRELRTAPAVDLLAGGFPCQDLSVAGRRAGLAGGRSRLFFEFVRVADLLAPRWLLVENVDGLLSSNGGEDFAVAVSELTGFRPAVPEGGWRSGGVACGPRRGLAWRVLDAQHCGSS